jgi:hypothetical protein
VTFLKLVSPFLSQAAGIRGTRWAKAHTRSCRVRFWRGKSLFLLPTASSRPDPASPPLRWILRDGEELTSHLHLIFVLLSINVTVTFYYLLFVDMFRPHTAIFRCYCILSRSWCSVMPINMAATKTTHIF